MAVLTRLLRDAEPCVLEDLRDPITGLLRDFLADFFSNFFKPAYAAVSGATQNIAELRFVFPRRADELLSALRAYEANRHKILAHGAIPSVSTSA